MEVPLSVTMVGHLANAFDVDGRKDAERNSSFDVTSSASDVDEGSKAKLRQFFVAGIGCLIILFSLLGNGLVVGAVASFHRLRSVTNYFVVSLAVADLTVALFVVPYSVLYEVWQDWVFGWTFCLFWISCDVMCCTASILHLCVIAVDRYLAINDPLTYATRLSSRRPGLVIAGAWTCSVAISFVPIFMGWFADDTVVLYSPHVECGLHVNKVYAIVSSATSFYLPLVVMVIVYAKIFCIARRQSMEIVKLEKSLDRNGSQANAHARRNGRDRKAIKTLGTLMGLFCFSWLPFFIVYVIRPFCGRDAGEFSPILVLTITWLGYCNSFFNPCVYALINKDFRFAYKRLILCQQRAFRLDQKHRVPSTPDVARERIRLTYDAVAHDCVCRDELQTGNDYEMK